MVFSLYGAIRSSISLHDSTQREVNARKYFSWEKKEQHRDKSANQKEKYLMLECLVYLSWPIS